MKKILTALLCVSLCACCVSGAPKDAKKEPPQKVYRVKIDGQISSPQVYIVKRAIRVANADGAKILMLDLDTPGGDLDSTVKIMEALGNFKGLTICHVNPNAISAGSFIASACSEIYFAPGGIMGAAEAVNSAGADIDDSMRRKIASFIGAKVRSLNSENHRRSDIQRAMYDPDFELKIGGKTLKKKGELLSLTAKEAAEIVGGKPLLSNGTAKDAAEILKAKSLENPEITDVEITWSETAAKYISAISPILIGLGFLLVFIDVKSGGFGLLSGIGACALLIVFVGANICGAAGHEGIIFFILGAALVAVEIFVFPGLFFPALIGAALIVGSLAWALGDIWPERGFEYNLDGFLGGLFEVAAGIAVSAAAIAAIWKFLPSSSFAQKLVLNKTEEKQETSEPVKKGDVGIAVSALMPSGRIDVGGKIVEATSAFSHIPSGAKVEVVGKKDFNFLVKEVN